jgi:mannose-6-phosphate isomerase-like protein (cupin superfamily)
MRPWIFAALYAAIAALSPGGQQKIVVEPDPSFREDAPSNRRHPGLDTDVSLYLNDWRNSPPREGHGGLIERSILTPGDPFHPPRKGAVLRFLKIYSRAELSPRTITREHRDDREQIFFYVLGGRGLLVVAGRSVELAEGECVVIPAGLAYSWKNPGDSLLELFLAAEDVTAGFVPNARISIGRSADSRPLLGAHWAHMARPFRFDIEPKFAHPMGFVPVSIDEFDIAQPHSHPAAAEEIWLQVKGRSLLFLGNRLFRQEPGQAFLVPPNNKVPHGSINPGGEPQLWLFFGCRK